MKSQPMPPVPPEIAKRISSLIASGMGQQQVIFEMRAAGLHIVDCMRLARDLYQISQNEAKFLVHESDAWASMRGEYDDFHDRLEAAAVQAGFEVASTSEDLQKAS